MGERTMRLAGAAVSVGVGIGATGAADPREQAATMIMPLATNTGTIRIRVRTEWIAPTQFFTTSGRKNGSRKRSMSSTVRTPRVLS